MKRWVLAIGVIILGTLPLLTQSTPAPFKPHNCSIEKGDGKVPYPDALKGSGIEGTVSLEAVIGLNGCAGDVRVIHKVHPQLDALAKQAVKSWRFSPATKNGKPVIVLIRIDVDFKENKESNH